MRFFNFGSDRMGSGSNPEISNPESTEKLKAKKVESGEVSYFNDLPDEGGNVILPAGTIIENERGELMQLTSDMSVSVQPVAESTLIASGELQFNPEEKKWVKVTLPELLDHSVDPKDVSIKFPKAVVYRDIDDQGNSRLVTKRTPDSTEYVARDKRAVSLPQVNGLGGRLVGYVYGKKRILKYPEV